MPRDKKSPGSEFRERVSALPEELKQTGADPFGVDIPHILGELREDYTQLKGPELSIDAKALNSVSQVVQLQDQWITGQLAGLQVNPTVLVDKVRSLDLRGLSSALLSSQHLPVGIKQVATKRLLEAAEYWIALQGWGTRPSLQTPQAIETGQETLDSMGEDLEEEVEETSIRLTSVLSAGPVPYEEVVSSEDSKERLRKAYVLSLVCARGNVTLRYDPVMGKYVVQKANGVPDSSVAVQV